MKDKASRKDIISSLRRWGSALILLGTAYTVVSIMSIIDKTYDRSYLFVSVIGFTVGPLLRLIARLLQVRKQIKGGSEDMNPPA